MKITDIYHKFKIPKNLQRHMLKVASVGKYISQNWTGDIDEKSVVETLLLHDLGNLLKFDFNKGMDLFDTDERDLDYWLDVQNEMKEKYSPDEHQATQIMAQEIGVSKRVFFLLQNIGSSNLYKVLESDDVELKICSYSDFRVSPNGFVTVEERFKDILQRYDGRDHALSDKEATIKKMHYCLELEKQLEPQLDVDLQFLPEKELEDMVHDLSFFII